LSTATRSYRLSTLRLAPRFDEVRKLRCRDIVCSSSPRRTKSNELSSQEGHTFLGTGEANFLVDGSRQRQKLVTNTANTC
jgi:hypothetical protein